MDILSNVLIKLTRGGFTDRVLYLDNVPAEMFYEMRYPMICKGEGLKQAYVPDSARPKELTLYEELKRSQTGDDGIVFDLDNEQAKHRYMILNRYIQSVYTNRNVPVDPVINSTDKSNTAAPALALSQVPRVVLPVLSPAEPISSVPGDTTASMKTSLIDKDKLKKEAIEEYKQEQRARMAKAREARKAPIGKNTR